MRRKKGQSVLEYTLLITAVILAIVYGVNTVIAKRGKAQMDNVETMLKTADTKLATAVAE